MKDSKIITKQDLIDICLQLPGAYEDYPFDDHNAVMRHTANKKTFALICEHEGRLLINLKCDPTEADFLRKIHKDIVPGWHMNKQHWNSVYPNGDVPLEMLKDMIVKSYDLIKPKIRRKCAPM